MAGAGVHDWMGVCTAGPEGLWWAGGHVAGRRAPTHLAGPHVMVGGLHTVHQAVDVVEGAVVQGPVQPMPVSDHRAVAVLPHSQVGHVSMASGMTRRSASSAPHPTSLSYHKKQKTPLCRKKEHHQPDGVLRKAGWHLGTDCYSGLNGGPPKVMSTSCPPESEDGTLFGSRVFAGVISYGSGDEVILDQGGRKSMTVSF